MPYTRLLAGAVAAAVLAAPTWALGPKGSKTKDPFKISPDMVYFNKTGNETTLVRTVSLHRVGPPGEAIKFTAAASTDAGGNWLSVSPTSGTIPAELTLTAVPGSLGPGVHTGKVTVTPSPGTGSPQVVGVMLRILTGPSGAPAAFVRPLSLNFQMTQGGANPEPRTLHISSPTGGASFTWTATRTILSPPGGAWLSITSALGTGPGLITVSVNGAGLTSGVYSAIITVTSGTASAQIPVTLEVRASAPSNLVIDPRAFNFIVHPGGPVPAPKILRVKNTGSGTLNWTALATSTGNWLSITPLSGTTPATIQVSVNPAGLARGHYAGTVQVTAGGKTETARVFLRLIGPPSPLPAPTTSTSAVQITPSAVEFCLCGGVLTPPSAAVQLTSRLTGLSFTATVVTAQGGNWLNVTPPAGTIPGTITVSATPGSLAAGVYTGAIFLSIKGAVTEQHNVPVTLRVSPLVEAPRLVVRPGAIAFQAVRGGANPAAQQVALEPHGAASIPFQATASTTTGMRWLSVTPAGGTAPATITVAVNTSGLAAGVYLGAVVFQATGTSAALPATLNVFLQILAPPTTAPDARSAAAESTGLLGFFLEPAAEFMATAGFPQPVLVSVKSADGKAVEGAAVEITPSTGEPSFALEDAGGGLYTGMFRSLSTGPVSLTATAYAGGLSASFGLGGDLEGGPAMPVIFSGGIVNAANYAPAPTPLVPGALVSLFGWNLADISATAPALPLPRELAGVKVLVGGIEAPLVSVSAGAEFDQISFQVPVEAAGLSYADVVVLSGGAFSAPEGIAIAPAVPALFTRNWQGTGVVAALHADYAELTPERPARPGDTVLLYATGLGEVSPAQVSGQAPTALSRLVAPVEVLIAGRAARTDFAGLAPRYAGLYQLNVVVPAGTPTGDASVEIIVGGVGSGAGVVIPVR